MPNRLLKESICVSEQINALTWFEEVVFYRLIVNCDDFGRYDGRVSVLKNLLFTIKDNMTLKQVSDAINKLASVGLVVLYEFEGRPFLQLPTWHEHQNVRAKRSKYPAPEDGILIHDIICKQMNTNDCKCSRNPIQSNPTRISDAVAETRAREDSEAAAEDSHMAVQAVPEENNHDSS